MIRGKEHPLTRPCADPAGARLHGYGHLHEADDRRAKFRMGQLDMQRNYRVRRGPPGGARVHIPGPGAAAPITFDQYTV